LLLSDLHVPYHDADLLERAIRHARSLGVRKWVVIGDLMDGNQWSKRGLQTGYQRRWQDDAEIGAAIVRVLVEAIGPGTVLMGNHDAWFVKHFRGQAEAEWLLSRMFRTDESVLWSRYEQARVSSGGRVVALTHGANYSGANPLGVGQRLSAKWGCGVVMGHQHHGDALRIELREQPHDVLAGLRIERARGLVGQHHHRLVHQRACDRHPLLLPAGEFGRRVLGAFTQSDLLQGLQGPRAARRRDPPRACLPSGGSGGRVPAHPAADWVAAAVPAGRPRDHPPMPGADGARDRPSVPAHGVDLSQTSCWLLLPYVARAVGDVAGCHGMDGGERLAA
jgi:UDP-2,3-diacylglucosamine pyrophosphatase LpxH